MQRYSDEFKARAVDLYSKGGITYEQLAKDLGVSRASLSIWISQAKAGGLSEKTNETEAEELKRLRKENVILKEEREILKKAALGFNWSAQHLFQFNSRRHEPKRLSWTGI